MIAPLQAGRLRHAVAIERAVRTEAASGAVVETWSTLATRKASIEPVTGRSYLAAAVEQAEVTHIIRLRWDAVIDDLTHRDRILFGTRVFEIRRVINIGERRRELQLLCIERIGD